MLGRTSDWKRMEPLSRDRVDILGRIIGQNHCVEPMDRITKQNWKEMKLIAMRMILRTGRKSKLILAGKREKQR